MLLTRSIKESRYSSTLKKAVLYSLSFIFSFSFIVSASAWTVDEADRYYFVGYWKKAAEAYGSLKRDDLSSEVLVRYAEACINAGDIACAREPIKVLEKRGDSSSAALSLFALAVDGRAKEAEERMRQLLSEKGEKGYFVTVHCAIWSMLDVSRAVDFCKKAAEIDDGFQAWFLLGQNYEELELFEDSTKAYKNAVKKNPLSALAHNNLGYSYKERHFYRYAIDEYSKAIELMPDRAGFYYNIGNAYTHEESIDLAFDSYRKAVELEPDFAKAHYNLGRTYLRLDRIEEAINEFRLYLKFATKAVFNSVAGKKAVEDEIEQLELYLQRHPSMRSQEKKGNK